MSSEKPSTKIIVQVVGGVILAGTLYLCRTLLIPGLKWCGGFVVSVWNWIFDSHAVPGWLIIILSVISVWCVVRVVMDLLSTLSKSLPALPREPRWTDFREFEFKGVLWRWDYYPSGEIGGLVSFCPEPDCRLQTNGEERFYGTYNQTTEYKCDRCGNKKEVEGTKRSIDNLVRREIGRLIDLGEWKKYVKPA